MCVAICLRLVNDSFAICSCKINIQVHGLNYVPKHLNFIDTKYHYCC